MLRLFSPAAATAPAAAAALRQASYIRNLPLPPFFPRPWMCPETITFLGDALPSPHSVCAVEGAAAAGFAGKAQSAVGGQHEPTHLVAGT